MSSPYNLVRDEKQPKYSIISLFTAATAMLYISRTQSLIQHCVHKVRHKIMKVNPQRFDFLSQHCIVLENVAAAQRGYAADNFVIHIRTVKYKNVLRHIWCDWRFNCMMHTYMSRGSFSNFIVRAMNIYEHGQYCFKFHIKATGFFLNVCFKIYVHPINQPFFFVQ